ncbi:tetratricopeptide repeat protein 27 [Caerostris darwini]|uniref:Tetratricopeptide repeat protein 27 n=1 Tax=Caerostris darwini TaxID=1538125 RepID=A0AAV4U3H1_9ARAC|nr:tetratricopeptide repeat protein 27 [Caerostris darwini]
MNPCYEAIAKNFNDLEIRCLTCNFENYDFNLNFASCKDISSSTLVKAIEHGSNSIISHDYKTILNSNLSDFGIKEVIFDPENKTFKCIFSEDNDDKLLAYMKELLLIFIGISALQQFVKANMCGPDVNDSSNYSLFNSVFPENRVTEEDVMQFLCRNGEFPVSNIVQLKLLFLSHLFLSCTVETEEVCLTRKWWLMRCLMMHQHILSERIASIHDEIVTLINRTFELKWIFDSAHQEALVTFYVECAQMHLHYQEVVKAKNFISKAQEIVGLEIELSGAYGKRTIYQRKALPQLLVNLNRNHEKLHENELATIDNSQFPPDLLLQDDTVLNKVSFSDVKDEKVVDILSVEQIVLLGYCCLVRKSEAFDELLREKSTAYISCLLEQRKTWSIYVKALIMRCKLEKDSSRRLERAIMQMESIINSLKKDDPGFVIRAPMLYAVAFPMIWTIEKELADLWMSVGATKSALAIYEKLQLWQDIVSCYMQLGRTSCAETLLREQLEKKETPLLWCLLGDALDDPDMYLKADELSKGTNARCQRSLAFYYFKRKDYEKSLPFFKRTLEINPLQCSVWFSYGFAALECKDYPLSAQAYRQVVMLDQDNFEAWNNLSNAYIRSQQKERAWRSLQEAIKCNYEEWRVWENFLLVSIDIGVFEDVIRAWHRLLDIKGKYLDPEILGILVRAITEDMPDFNGQPASKFKKEALKLLGRLSSIVPGDYSIWEAYSALLCPDPTLEKDLEVFERSIHYQQKAIQIYTQNNKWESNLDLFKMILKKALRLCNLSLVYMSIENPKKDKVKSSVKLALLAVFSKAEKHLFQFSEREELEKELNHLRSMAAEIQSL